ncbi:hypothetical protein MUY14_44820 [Amycolatopsis sp. FBCC-B4732]|uniref:hypothetical protein n=1 Tax=Amycolatopsis sp. FBCC-B4732 TaxID=3079339 RepID=UPI001FF54B96|nr:hypothetical protein [Amycolatopsis sp. FBCC-B4732]UOX88719.1 hypothetical protein MUY14_44820 [Amycolatopsis sp. FBCC-B4732]
MPKTIGDEGRSPDRPSDHTVWWAIVEVLTSAKLYRRLVKLLCLVGVVIIVLAALAAITFSMAGTDATTVFQEFAALVPSFRLKAH